MAVVGPGYSDSVRGESGYFLQLATEPSIYQGLHSFKLLLSPCQDYIDGGPQIQTKSSLVLCEWVQKRNWSSI